MHGNDNHDPREAAPGYDRREGGGRRPEGNDGGGLLRVRYFDGQYLRRQDFTDEQSYQIAVRRQHNIANHTWGIVQGLEPTVSADGTEVWIEAGMAVDGFGRVLQLMTRRRVPPQRLLRSDVFALSLLYHLEPVAPASPGWACRSPERPAPDTRWQEIPRLRVTPLAPGESCGPDLVEPVGAAAVPDPQAVFIPPDDPHIPAPVFLGCVLAGEDDQGRRSYTVDLAQRTYAGLVGNELRRTDDRGLRLALDPVTSSDRGGRFRVYRPDPEGNAVDRLVADADDGVVIHGDLTVEGDVAVAGAVDFELPTVAKAAAGSWLAALVQPPETAGHELRIQIPAGRKGEHRVAIGSWSDDAEAFVPALMISDDGRVRIPGDLVVEGRLVRAEEETPVPPETEGALLGAFLEGQAGAQTLPEPLLRALAIQLAQHPEKLLLFLCLLVEQLEQNELYRQAFQAALYDLLESAQASGNEQPKARLLEAVCWLKEPYCKVYESWPSDPCDPETSSSQNCGETSASDADGSEDNRRPTRRTVDGRPFPGIPERGGEAPDGQDPGEES